MIVFINEGVSHALPANLKIGSSIFKVKSPELETELLNYEANNMRRSHKIGVMYCPKGARTEADMVIITFSFSILIVYNIIHCVVCSHT